MKDTLPKPRDPDEVFLEMANKLSELSKDPTTKVGCMITRANGSPVSFGYNGFPRKIEDKKEYWENRDPEKGFTKHELVRHAEENAISFGRGSLEGCTLYVTLTPCLGCAVDIIAEGIVKVVYNSSGKWTKDLGYNKSLKLLELAGVELKPICLNEEKDN